VVAKSEVLGPDGRPAISTLLLFGLHALSRLTRLTSLTVEGGPPPEYEQGTPYDGGMMATSVLQALPPGAPLVQVGAACDLAWGGNLRLAGMRAACWRRLGL
jgi:hypothetical protein